MALKWTLLASLALFVLFISSFVLFEVNVHPSPEQRHQFANGVWTIAGLLFVALWAWFIFRSRNPPRSQGKRLAAVMGTAPM